MVLLDGLVECGLAQQQEAEANPHGQQPGHGKAESAGQHTGGGRTGQELYYSVSPYIFTTHTLCFNLLCQTKETNISSEILCYQLEIFRHVWFIYRYVLRFFLIITLGMKRKRQDRLQGEKTLQTKDSNKRSNTNLISSISVLSKAAAV